MEIALASALAEVADLRRSVELREAFIAAIGHELRNPMVPILLSVERLRGVATGPAQAGAEFSRLRRSIEVLGHATDAFMRRATQLLDLSRLGTDTFLLQPASCDLAAIVRDTVLRHDDIARRAGCVLTLDVPGELACTADQAAIEQLLDNLLSNAFKYGAGRPVGVRLHASLAELSLVVSDAGQGIPPDEQEAIFGLFKRARDPGAPGLGIGLWIASQLAVAMGGTLAVDSLPGRGAAFTLRVPRRGNARRDLPPPVRPGTSA